MRHDQSDRDRDRLLRAFLAIPLDNTTLNDILTIQQRLKPNMPDVRWTIQNNLHLTLNFFGDITEENLEKVAKTMVSVGSLFMPFSLTLTEIGAFPSTDHARVVWLGVKSDKLEELYRALQAELILAGLLVERRPFRPHITIGRSRQQAGRILSQRGLNVAGSMRVEELILYESRLQPTGAEHRPRQTVRLAEH
jgi:2'-5' RNA ligase